MRHLTAGGEDAERDREVETAAVLGQFGGRQVHGNAAVGIFELGVLDRDAHAITGFAHRGFRQPDDGSAGQAAGKVHLHGDQRRDDAFGGSGQRNGKAHVSLPSVCDFCRKVRLWMAVLVLLA